MTNDERYFNLVTFLKKELRDNITRIGLVAVADRLGLLPVGVEVLLARGWTLENTLHVAGTMGYAISFEVS